jgi:hypothetical protein
MPASGEIQSDGTFELTSGSSNDGAAPGTYRIRVIESKVTDKGTVFTNYVGPRDKTLEVVSGHNNEFAVSISEKDGWQIRGRD